MIKFGVNTDMILIGGDVQLNILVDNEPVICKFSQEAIMDKYHLSGDTLDNEVLRIAQEHFDELTDSIHDKILIGDREEDGSLLIRTRDLA